MKRIVRRSSLVRISVAAVLAVGASFGQTRIDTLKNVRVPAFNGVDQYVRDNQALIALGAPIDGLGKIDFEKRVSSGRCRRAAMGGRPARHATFTRAAITGCRIN